MHFSAAEADLESQNPARQHSVLQSSSFPNIEFGERAFEPLKKGRGYEEYRESPVEPFSSYRNSSSMPHPTDEYPNETCQSLNCWQTVPHQHSTEELQYLVHKRRTRLEYDSSEDEERVQRRREARKIAKAPTKLRSSRGLNRLVEQPASLNRDLRSALPDNSELAAQATSEQSNLAQLLIHRPANRTFDLVLRPKPSKLSTTQDASLLLAIEGHERTG